MVMSEGVTAETKPDKTEIRKIADNPIGFKRMNLWKNDKFKDFMFGRVFMSKHMGVLCHITSLPSSNVSDSQKFLTWLNDNDFSVWQMLPINPPDAAGSPYSSCSAFAGWSEICSSNKKHDMLEENYWLKDWAVYSAIKVSQGGKPWYEWPEKLKNRDPDELSKWENKISTFLDEQESFQAGWGEFRNFSREFGVKLFGDLPIFVSHDSADVWAHRELFQLDDNGYPTYVSGVPPDYFSKKGQKWGTVLYNWPAHQKENWQWWKQRVRRMLRLFDMVRIDHFRGFESCWAIPVKDKTAKNGHWQKGPGDEILKAIMGCASSDSQIIAEDLGIIPDEVIQLRKRNNIMGMAVLHFGFDGDENNPNHPSNICQDQVAYVATHDNDTTLGWWKTASNNLKKNVRKLAKEDEDINDTMIRLAKESNSKLIIIPLQDIMKLDSDSRMNKPGKTYGNWNWKFDWHDLNL